MRKFLILLLAVAVTPLVLAAPDQAPQADPQFEELAALVARKMTEYGVPGVAFGMVRHGKVTMRGFGVTNVDDPQPVTPDTVFALASISKTVTATAIMRLAEQGKLDLSAPVRECIGLHAASAAARDVTIWHL